VDVQSASALLGVSMETTPDEVRRAYLRKVKQHKPETDPEGFARVRDAFELLKQFQTYAQFVRSPGVPQQGASTAVPAQSVAARIETPSPSPSEAPAEPTPEHAKTSAEDVPDESLSVEDQADDHESRQLEQRFAQVPYFDLEGKSKFFREEWDRPSTDLFWFTLQKLSPYGPMRDLLCECMRRAVDLNMPHALPYLVRFGPRLVRNEEMGRLLNSDREDERFLGARLLAWHERDSEMFEVVSEMFALEAVGDQPVPAAALVDLALYCVELSRPQVAGALVKMLVGHFDKFQDENKVLHGNQAIRWALLRETVALASTIAPRYLAKAVQAVQSNAEDAITDAASDLLESRGRANLDETRRLLHHEAPALEKMLNVQTAVVYVDPKTNRRFRIPQVSPVLLAFLGLTVVRLVTSSFSYDSSPSQSYQAPYSPTPSAASALGKSKEARPEVGLFRTSAQWIARNHCEDGPLRVGGDLRSVEPKLTSDERQECRRMQRILISLDDDTCNFEVHDWRAETKVSKAMKQFMEQAWKLRHVLCDTEDGR